MIFIRLGSRAWRRSNQDGPSLKGATAVMRESTLIWPSAMRRIASGYSPAEAQEPWRRIWRETTFCRGQGDLGGDVADEGDGTAFADGVDGGGDGIVAAYGFEDDVHATAFGEVEDLLGERGTGGLQGLVGVETVGEREAGGVDVGDEDPGGSGGSCGLEEEEADHACADDEDGFAALQLRDGYAVEATETASSMAASGKLRFSGRW